MTARRYDIVLVCLDSVLGGEMALTRPAVVVSADEMNAALETIVVCPLTAKVHPQWRSRIQITTGGKRAEIAVDQIRTISRQRLVRRLGKLSSKSASELRRAISEMYGDG